MTNDDHEVRITTLESRVDALTRSSRRRYGDNPDPTDDDLAAIHTWLTAEGPMLRRSVERAYGRPAVALAIERGHAAAWRVDGVPFVGPPSLAPTTEVSAAGVARYLVAHGPTTMSDLRDEFNKNTIRRRIDELLASGVVVQGTLASNGGRPALIFAIHPDRPSAPPLPSFHKGRPVDWPRHLQPTDTDTETGTQPLGEVETPEP